MEEQNYLSNLSQFEGLSLRKIAERSGHNFRTVKKYVDNYHTVINARSGGKRKQISRTTGLKIKNNFRRAQQILEDLKHEYDENGLSGLLVMEERNAAQSMLLSEYMEKWVERKKSEIAYATYISYSGMVKSRIKRFFDPIGVTVASATPQIFDDFIEELQDAGLKSRAMTNQNEQERKAAEQAFWQRMALLDEFEDWLYERKFGRNENEIESDYDDEDEDEWER